MEWRACGPNIELICFVSAHQQNHSLYENIRKICAAQKKLRIHFCGSLSVYSELPLTQITTTTISYSFDNIIIIIISHKGQIKYAASVSVSFTVLLALSL